MATPRLRLVSRPTADAGTALAMGQDHARLVTLLVEAGKLRQADLDAALARRSHETVPLGEILLSDGVVPADDMCAAIAAQSGTIALDPGLYDPDTALIDALGAAFCALNEVLPLRRLGAATLVVTARPERFDTLRPVVEARIGPVLMAAALPDQLNAALLAVRRRHLSMRAETRAAPEFSCRTLSARNLTVKMAIIGLAITLTGVTAPLALFNILTAVAMLVLLANTTLGIAAIWIRLATPQDTTALTDPPPLPARPVSVSILVPLFRERQIASSLIERLSRIDYPRVLIEILLIVEEDDQTTRDTLAMTPMPSWMRIIEVPRGAIRTKPKALNFALEFCRGAIVGIYDAEDEPDPQQVRRAVEQFRLSPPQVACLQGQLDFYNPHRNWISRCFTIDYAVWFRLILPALAKLGLVIPLGGTTLFLRRTALVRLGGWDAHNVTEDADLGVRLARLGFRTDLLKSVTLEEANCRFWPWVRQRSRWQKGYAMTWLVHMRAPVTLLRDLGVRRFFGVQLLFLGSLGGAIMQPVLWGFMLLALGFPHPWTNHIGPIAGIALTAYLAFGLLVQWTLGWLALKERGTPGLASSVPLITVYHLMATVAVAKAIAEMLYRPFYWDKTSHGDHHDASTPVMFPPTPPP